MGCSWDQSRPLGEKPPSLRGSVSACHGHPGATAAATTVLLPEAGEGHGREEPGTGDHLLLSLSHGVPVSSPWAEGGASLEANSVCSRGSLLCCELPLDEMCSWTRPPHPGPVVLHILACPPAPPITCPPSARGAAPHICPGYTTGWSVPTPCSLKPGHPQMVNSDVLKFIICLCF